MQSQHMHCSSISWTLLLCYCIHWTALKLSNTLNCSATAVLHLLLNTCCWRNIELLALKKTIHLNWCCSVRTKKQMWLSCYEKKNKEATTQKLLHKETQIRELMHQTKLKIIIMVQYNTCTRMPMTDANTMIPRAKASSGSGCALCWWPMIGGQEVRHPHIDMHPAPMPPGIPHDRSSAYTLSSVSSVNCMLEGQIHTWFRPCHRKWRRWEPQ